MKFQMPFNSRVQIRLFEPIETVNDCYRMVDVGLEYPQDQGSPRIDSIGMGYASQFHVTRPVSDIQKDVDKANAPVPTTPSPDKADEATASN